MMTLYTQPYCAPCKGVKAKLDEMEIVCEITDDLAEFPEGVRSVPTLSHGNKLISGAGAIHNYLNELSKGEE